VRRFPYSCILSHTVYHSGIFFEFRTPFCIHSFWQLFPAPRLLHLVNRWPILLPPGFFSYFYSECDSMRVPCKQLAYLAVYDIPDTLFAAPSLMQHPTKGLIPHIDNTSERPSFISSAQQR
jgi:hypothetical protein